ncbi:MAG: fructose-1,6-bisphosphatase [Lachnospiraceae bacterium]|nr:fructose-1,6-bisphosphatase [Lachnospiraceae bacterium]
MNNLELKYLKSLAVNYPTIAAASTEIINLHAILQLPKGTEHFISDVHGEHEQVLHTLRTGSGAIKGKIDDVFGNTISSRDKKRLAALIYYPEAKLKDVLEEYQDDEEFMLDWYKLTLNRLIMVTKECAEKYTRSKLRKCLPPDFSYILEEMLSENNKVQAKEAYYNEIFDTIIRINRADAFIIALGNLIQRLVVDHLHVIGDIFDRGPGAHIIMDHLMAHHNVDIQWGNHDIVWMGAASGHEACIANVIRLSARYNNLAVLEEGYGINLIPLARFALDTYGDDPCTCFDVHAKEEEQEKEEIELNMKMHKAISIIQFKLEGQLINRRPEFNMDKRNLLDKINYETGMITIGGKEYQLKDSNFPTIDSKDPYKLSEEEESLMRRLRKAFLNCEKLQNHIRFLFAHGSLYLCYNSNLLYHGCVPLNEDGSFRKVKIGKYTYSGKALYDVLEYFARKGYYEPENENEYHYGQDIMWYIWSNENSPVYGKEKMATFERYFLDDKQLQQEKKDYYYQLIENESVVNHILEEFGMDPEHSHIINGHMPVELKKGESPIRCGGKVLIIDGGFSKAYQSKTGIAGYTLIFNSRGLTLVSHEPFTSMEDVVKRGVDIHSSTQVVHRSANKVLVSRTDIGKTLLEKISDLESLLKAYHSGIIQEKI